MTLHTHNKLCQSTTTPIFQTDGDMDTMEANTQAAWWDAAREFSGGMERIFLFFSWSFVKPICDQGRLQFGSWYHQSFLTVHWCRHVHHPHTCGMIRNAPEGARQARLWKHWTGLCPKLILGEHHWPGKWPWHWPWNTKGPGNGLLVHGANHLSAAPCMPRRRTTNQANW